MSTDRGLEATRAIREKISHEHGNNPRRLVEYYLKYQARFADRERGVTLLPGEGFTIRKSQSDPPGRIGFEGVDQIGNGDCRWQGGV